MFKLSTAVKSPRGHMYIHLGAVSSSSLQIRHSDNLRSDQANEADQSIHLMQPQVLCRGKSCMCGSVCVLSTQTVCWFAQALLSVHFYQHAVFCFLSIDRVESRKNSPSWHLCLVTSIQSLDVMYGQDSWYMS